MLDRGQRLEDLDRRLLPCDDCDAQPAAAGQARDDVADRTRGAHAAVVDDADHRAELGELREDVARDDDRLAHALELLEDLAHLHSRPRVEARGGFVEQQHCGIVDQGARQAHALLQATRERVDELALALGHADQRQQVVDDLLAPLLRLSVARRIEVEVLADAELVVHAEEVGHVADAGVDLLTFLGHVGAVDERPAAGGFEERGENTQRRRLARAVGADETKDLALRHLERDVVQRQAAAVGLGQVLDRDHCTDPESESQPVAN